MKIKGWNYYKHAVIPACAPHEFPDLSPVSNGDVWNIDKKKPLFARWTTDFDCGQETDWWYVIKDEPFELSGLKAKRRYEINKGKRNFEVVEINPQEHKDDLYVVTVAAFSAYPEKYRPKISKEEFFRDVANVWQKSTAFGAFHRETGKLCGYALVSDTNERNLDFWSLKADPDYEKDAVNAALVEGVLQFFITDLTNGRYICDGARSTNHETAFQDYLEKYFGFRKAYCRLHIKYNPKVRWLMYLLYPCRNFLRLFDFVGIVHQLNSVLKMEEHSVSRSNSSKKQKAHKGEN